MQSKRRNRWFRLAALFTGAVIALLAVSPAFAHETGGAAPLPTSLPPAPAPLQTTTLPSAQLSPDGRTAIAPVSAPDEVKSAIYAANQITRKPYRRRPSEELSGQRLRLLRLGQLRPARGRISQAAVRLELTHGLGRLRAGPVDHGLHESRPRLRRARRLATGHIGVAERTTLAPGRAGQHRLHRASPRRLLTKKAGDGRAKALHRAFTGKLDAVRIGGGALR